MAFQVRWQVLEILVAKSYNIWWRIKDTQS